MSLRFERSVEEYFQTRKNLEYLDLEIKEPKEVVWNEVRIFCFENGHQHELYSQHKQLNSVVDLAFTNLRNTNCVYDQLKLLSKVSISNFHKILEKFDFLGTGLDAHHPLRINDKVAGLALQVKDLNCQLEKLVQKGPLSKQYLENFAQQQLRRSEEAEARTSQLAKETKQEIQEVKELLKTIKSLLIG